jgi:glycosyltransferase involved in cell wall biosynthesis
MSDPSGASPLISIVVPSFNYGHLIAQTLDSVAAQSATDWECLVVDDGSTDNTAQVVAAYTRRDRRFSYLAQRNSGLSAARNAGLRRASGVYIQFLDADDLIEPGKLHHHASYLATHPGVGVVYGPARYFTSAEPTQPRQAPTYPDPPWLPPISGSGSVLLTALFDRNILPVNSALTRRDVVRRVGFFDERLRALEDWDYWTRCALAGVHFQFLDQEGTYALVRLHTGSVSTDPLRMHVARARHYRSTVRVAPDSIARSLLHGRMVHARKVVSRLRIARGMLVRGALSRALVAFSQREYFLAAKVMVALVLVPVLGRGILQRLAER